MVLRGHPSDELLRYSLESKTDLLVMGSVGKSGLNRFLLGSVAEKVAQHSKVPVILVPGIKD
jgi:nucleotide-binding universal stress UspA family protein